MVRLVVVVALAALVMGMLNSFGKLTPFGDSNRLRKWLQTESKQG